MRNHYSKALVSVTLCPEPLYSAPLCSMHGHARRCSSLLSEITIRKCWSRFHCALRPLRSALLCYVHGYARVHTSIYIYIYTGGSRAKGRSGALHVPSPCLRHRSPQVPPGRSKWFKKVQKCSKRRKEAQKGARRGCSSLPGVASALEEAVPACFGAACALKEAVRDRCSQKLVSVALCSEPLHSALLCSVHGYARSKVEQSTVAQVRV